MAKRNGRGKKLEVINGELGRKKEVLVDFSNFENFPYFMASCSNCIESIIKTLCIINQ